MALNMSVTRVQRELLDFAKATDSEKEILSLESMSGQLDHLKGTIRGPPGTPYEGGTFLIDIKIPNDYPFRPPVMQFLTRVWHPNISSQTGAICLDILKTNWAAAMTLMNVLISIQSLLSSPVADDPQDAIVANQFKTNRSLFDRTARYWAHFFAGAPNTVAEFEDKVEMMVAMGFDREQALETLSWQGWDVVKASEKLAP